MFNTRNKSIKYASLLTLLLGFSGQSIQSMEELNRNEMDIDPQNTIILDTIVFNGQEYDQGSTSNTRKPGTKRKVVSKNTVGYVFNEHLIDMIPFDVWHIIFDHLGKSKNSFVETNKSFQCIADKYYGFLNQKNGYFVWDNKQVWCDFTQRMIYFSNKTIEELMLRFSYCNQPRYNIYSDELGKRILKIMALIKKDASFFKRDNLIKLFSTLLEKSIRASNQSFINHRDKVISKINDCQNYNESIENLLSLTKINLKKAQKNILNLHSGYNKPAFDKIQNTSTHINNLLKKKELTQECLKKILEDLLVSLVGTDKSSISPISNTIKEFNEQCRLSVRFTEIMYRYIANHLSDTIPLENSNYNSNENLVTSLGIDKDPFFLQVTEGIQHVKNLVFKYNMNQNHTTADLQEIIDLRGYSRSYNYSDLAKRYHDDKNIEQADKYCIKFIEMFEAKATGNDFIGAHNAYFRAGNQAEADRCLFRAIEMKGEYATVDDLRSASNAHLRMGNQAESDKFSIRVIEKVGEDATLRDLRWAVNAYSRMGNGAEADKCVIRLIEIAGDKATNLDLEMATAAYGRAKDFEKVEECKDRIIDNWWV